MEKNERQKQAMRKKSREREREGYRGYQNSSERFYDENFNRFYTQQQRTNARDQSVYAILQKQSFTKVYCKVKLFIYLFIYFIL